MGITAWTRGTAIGLGVAALAARSGTTAGQPVAPSGLGSARTPATASAPATPTSIPAPPEGAAFTDPEAVRVLLADAGHDIVATNSYDYRHLTEYRRTALAATTDPLTETLTSAIAVIANNAPALHA